MKKLPPYYSAISSLDGRARLGTRLKEYGKEYEFEKEYEFWERFRRISRIHKKRVPNLDKFRGIFA